MEEKKKKTEIDFRQLGKILHGKKNLFLKVWFVTFILSCLWIFPQPRYYTTKVSIAPESADPKEMGSIASLASNFGVSLGNGTNDAIYPQLYPDLFKSTEFLVSLLDIKVRTKDGTIDTDYYTYMKRYQKQNILLLPFYKFRSWIASLGTKKEPPIQGKNGKRFDPFQLTKETNDVLQMIEGNVKCTYSRTTEVVTINVTDQDALVCALLADSIKAHLQEFITDYRTKKSRINYEHYKKLTQEARAAYEQARKNYATYADANMDVQLQGVRSRIDDLENEMQLRYNVYSALNTRQEAALAKVLENTPAFTTLTNATVPVKPTGPKRVLFIAAMLFVTTAGTVVYLLRKELIAWF